MGINIYGPIMVISYFLDPRFVNTEGEIPNCGVQEFYDALFKYFPNIHERKKFVNHLLILEIKQEVNYLYYINCIFMHFI